MLFPTFSLAPIFLALLLSVLPTLTLAANRPSPDTNAFPIRYPTPAIDANAPNPSPAPASSRERQARGLFGHPVGEGAVVAARSEAESIAIEERAAFEEAMEGARMEKRVRKRGCAYVGTFFKLIDCNAPKDSTEVPYKPKGTAAPTSAH